jgi:hypothetical protein
MTSSSLKSGVLETIAQRGQRLLRRRHSRRGDVRASTALTKSAAAHGPSGTQKQAKELISLNTTVRLRSILPRCEKVITRMSEDMTDKQNAVALQPTTDDTPRTNPNQTAEERRFQDALEDDEVREALKLLHARGKNRRDEVV